jgi:hypothetical protein
MAADDRKIRGVFIGIDSYQAPEINELGCAERDARVLHALFADTFGDGAGLLVGEQATRAAIEARFAALAHADADDDPRAGVQAPPGEPAPEFPDAACDRLGRPVGGNAA